MNRIASPSFLRTILLIDAATCVAMAALLITAGALIEDWLAIPTRIQHIAVIILLPFAGFVAYIATRPIQIRGAVWLIIIGNAGWVAASLALLLIDGAMFNLTGKAFIAAQAAAVMLLAELEFFSLRKSGTVIA